MSATEPKALLETEKELLGSISALTNEQARLLSSEDIDGVRESLAKRRELMEKLDAIKPELEALSERDAGVRAARASTGDVLREIQRVNDQNRETLERLMTQLSNEIRQTSDSHKGLGGYAQRPAFDNSEYFDRKQ